MCPEAKSDIWHPKASGGFLNFIFHNYKHVQNALQLCSFLITYPLFPLLLFLIPFFPTSSLLTLCHVCVCVCICAHAHMCSHSCCVWDCDSHSIFSVSYNCPPSSFFLSQFCPFFPLCSLSLGWSDIDNSFSIQ